MSNIKRYTINWNDEAELSVEIDHDVMTSDLLHEINNFWGGHHLRLLYEGWDEDNSKETNDRALLHAVLKMLAQVSFGEMASSRWTADGLIRWFKSDTEGWPPMDGSCGLTILSCDYVDFDTDDMQVREA